VIRILAVALSMLSIHALAQSTEPARYQTRLENDVVAVYQVNLATHASTSAFQSAHDTFWVSLTDSSVSFSRQQAKTDIHWQSGDTRFFPSFDTNSLSNTGITEFRGVMISLKRRGLISGACDCVGNTAKTICGCKGAAHLDPLWALSLGEVTLAGTSLSAGESFRAAALRDDMLLVAVTDLNLTDLGIEDGDSADRVLRLKSGEAIWITGGRHQFKNVGGEAARFVTFEF